MDSGPENGQNLYFYPFPILRPKEPKLFGFEAERAKKGRFDSRKGRKVRGRKDLYPKIILLRQIVSIDYLMRIETSVKIAGLVDLTK